MEDMDVGGFEAPKISIETFLKKAQEYKKSHNGFLSFMDLLFQDDPEGIRSMVEEGNFDQETADLLQMSSRLELFDIRGGSAKVDENPSDYPYYILFVSDNEPNLVFMKDPRLTKVVDWRG